MNQAWVFKMQLNKNVSFSEGTWWSNEEKSTSVNHEDNKQHTCKNKKTCRMVVDSHFL